jgi:replicative superfamily II helicase
LPDKFPAPTALESIYPKTLRDLGFPEVESMLKQNGTTEFNAIQSQVFEKIYKSRDSVFVGAPTSSDLLTIAELAIFNEL